MQEELLAFLADRGIILDAHNARALLSAMSVSRLVLLKTEKGVDYEKFTRALSDFFACEHYMDDVSCYTSPDDLLYKKNGAGYQSTAFATALENATEDVFAMKIAHLVNADAVGIGGYTSQLMRYFVKPDVEYSIATKNKAEQDKTYALKSNLWIFMALEEDVLIDTLPAYIAEPATIVRLQIVEGVETNTVGVRHPVSVKQFVSMTEKARNHFELKEKQWKYVDKLEEYVQARVSYHISNKLWQKMEKYASVYLALGGDSDRALDAVVANKMLLTVLSLVAVNRREDDELFTHVLENILGEDRVKESSLLVELSGVDMGEVVRKEAMEKAMQKRSLRLEALQAAQKAQEQEQVQEETQEQAQEVQETEQVQAAEADVAETAPLTEEAAVSKEATGETEEAVPAEETSKQEISNESSAEQPTEPQEATQSAEAAEPQEPVTEVLVVDDKEGENK